MSLTQLNPPIPVRVPPNVDALAVAVIDRGPGTHLEWVCHILEGTNARCCWTFVNKDIRFNTSITEGWSDMRPFTPEQMEQFWFLSEPEAREPRSISPRRRASDAKMKSLK